MPPTSKRTTTAQRISNKSILKQSNKGVFLKERPRTIVYCVYKYLYFNCCKINSFNTLLWINVLTRTFGAVKKKNVSIGSTHSHTAFHCTSSLLLCRCIHKLLHWPLTRPDTAPRYNLEQIHVDIWSYVHIQCNYH